MVDFGGPCGYVGRMPEPTPDRRIHPLLKLALEVGPIAVFFLAYRMAPVPEGLGVA